MENNIIYAFIYCSNYHESAAETISLHWTEDGAQKALLEHKAKCLIDFKRYQAYHNSQNCHVGDEEFGFCEVWDIISMEVLP